MPLFLCNENIERSNSSSQGTISPKHGIDMNGSKSQGNEDFKWALGPNRLNLKFIGLLRTTSDNKKQQRIYDMRFSVILLTIIVSTVMPGFLALQKVWGNLTLTIDNLQFTMPFSVAAMKLFALWSKREVLAVMNDIMLADWIRERTDKEREIMRKWAQLSRMITIAGNLLTYTATILFITLPWFGLPTRIPTNTKHMDDRFVLQSYFPHNISKSSIFFSTYLLQICGVGLSAITYTGVDSYLIVLIFHICAQFHNLYERILNMGEFNNFSHALASCVQEHVRLLRFIDIIDNSFTMMLLILLMYFGLLFCFYGFIMINQITEDSLPFGRMLYTSMSVSVTFSHMCLFCVIGEMLVVHTESVYYATYDYEWYTLQPKEAKYLISIMTHAVKPKYITAGKLFPMTMAMFCSLLKTSAGYISVLIANQS